MYLKLSKLSTRRYRKIYKMLHSPTEKSYVWGWHTECTFQSQYVKKRYFLLHASQCNIVHSHTMWPIFRIGFSNLTCDTPKSHALFNKTWVNILSTKVTCQQRPFQPVLKMAFVDRFRYITFRYGNIQDFF